MTVDDVAKEINQLIKTYDFPLHVLQDVNHRLICCENAHYAAQQLRYLQNIVKAGLAVKRGS